VFTVTFPRMHVGLSLYCAISMQLDSCIFCGNRFAMIHCGTWFRW